MEKEAQDLEWSKAQEIGISVDLVKAAKDQLRFLAVIDGVPSLHSGPALDHAIYRYTYCWLPLLAKHADSPVSVEPLVVPLDCEWIWHCHRLNPVQYEIDCEEMFGKLLDNLNVLSTTKATCSKHTEGIWNNMYLTEPHRVKLGRCSSTSIVGTDLGIQRSAEYDLVAAVKRQSSFFCVKVDNEDDLFLKEAVARYRAFLHLIKREREKSIPSFFCVPTGDIDLIWHSHQLHPLSYSKDLKAILRKIVDHNDRKDSTNGNRLETGFKETAALWEETFGRQYLRATPTPAYNDQVAYCGSECVEGFTEYGLEGLGRSTPCASEGADVTVQAECCSNCVDG